MDRTTFRPPKKIPQKDRKVFGDDWPSPDASPGIQIDHERRNQHRLAVALGDNDTIYSDAPGFDPPPFPGHGNLDTDIEKTSISSFFRSSTQPEERHTSDRSPPGESHLDSVGVKENTSKSHVYADPGLGRPHTTIGPSHQSGEYHGREQVTDHGKNLGSGRRHPEGENLSPSQPAAGSTARKWEYIRQYMGRETKFEYEYDEAGRLVADGGYKSSEIEMYLCNHDLYKRPGNIKDRGLTLWIQRAPRTADYRGGAAEGLCLYEQCYVSKHRFIKAGDVRVAFDESAAQTPEYDSRTNVGYIHLKCLESHMKDHRRIFADLNFKVEGRKPQRNDASHRNPTIFGTIQEIVYIEDYLEQCRKDGEASPDSKAPELGPLSSGIEKQTQGQSERARDMQRKLLELYGFHSIKSWLDKKYADVGGLAETASPIQGRPPEINSKESDTRRHEIREQAQGADSNLNDASFDDEGYQPGENQEYEVHDDMPFDPYHPQVPAPTGRRKPLASPALPKLTVPDLTKEPSRHPQKKQSNSALPSKPPKSKGKEKEKDKIIRAPYEGQGKKKKRMYLDALEEEVWEEYEDPWSPLESGSDDEPKKRTRVSRKEKAQVKALAASAQDVGRKKNKRQRVDLNYGEGGDDVDEAEGEDGDWNEGKDEVGEDHQARKRRK